jgi:hypothetical protein
MPAITVFTRSLVHEFPFSAHKTGCADIARREIRERGAFPIYTAENIEAAEAQWTDEDELGWLWDDVEVYPCCK